MHIWYIIIMSKTLGPTWCSQHGGGQGVEGRQTSLSLGAHRAPWWQNCFHLLFKTFSLTNAFQLNLTNCWDDKQIKMKRPLSTFPQRPASSQQKVGIGLGWWTLAQAWYSKFNIQYSAENSFFCISAFFKPSRCDDLVDEFSNPNLTHLPHRLIHQSLELLWNILGEIFFAKSASTFLKFKFIDNYSRFI